MMTDHPMIFSAPMIRAMLDGRKTQDRRVIKDAPGPGWHCDPSPTGLRWVADGGAPSMPVRLKYAVGDRIWARETWADVNTSCGPGIGYKADNDFYQPKYDGRDFGAGPSYNYKKYPGNYSMWFCDLLAGSPDHAWRSPIHMPRWASRLTLLVESVRVQRLQDISDGDARAEGISVLPLQDADDPSAWWQSEPGEHQARTPVGSYRLLWNSLHGPDAWSLNPFVAAIGFRVIKANIDSPEAR